MTLAETSPNDGPDEEAEFTQPVNPDKEAKIIEPEDFGALKKLRYAGKRLKPSKTFAVRMAASQGGAATLVLNLDGDEARLFVLAGGKQLVQLWKAPVARDGATYTMIGKDKQPRTPITIQGGKLSTGKTTLAFGSVKAGGSIPLVQVEGDLGRLLAQIGKIAGGPTPEYLVPPYDGCCVDCCWVHEGLGLPDWCDAFCCQGNCGGSGSCTPDEGGSEEGVDPDEDSDEAQTETVEG